MKRLLTFVVMLSVVVWAGYTATVWWLANQQLASAGQALEGIGVISRDRLGSGVTGELNLAGGSYQDYRLAQPVTIERLDLVTGSPLALITMLIDPQRLPPVWTMEARGVRLAIEAAMFRNWMTATGQEQRSLFAPVCGPDRRQQLGSGDLVRLGIREITGEAKLRQGRAGVHFEITTAGTGSLEADWPGARLSLADPESLLTSSTQPLNLTIRDGGMMRKIAAYCARESGLEPGAWTALVLEEFRRSLNARGLDASRQLLALYRQWINEGGELSLQLKPAAEHLGIPVQGIENLGDQNQPGLAISYNGAAVPDVYLLATEPKLPRMPRQALEPVVPDGPGAALAGWRETGLENAGNWQGHTVRVTLVSGRVVEGRLVSVDERRLEVARTVDGGEVVYPMALRGVTRFDVWRRGR